MKLLLTAYDPSRQRNGSYWAWAHPELPPDLPGRFYDRLDAEDKPGLSAEILNLQKPDHCRGGCLSLDRTWCCVYRFLYGGLDRSGRQCFVLLCGFGHRRDLARADWLEVLDQGPWAELIDRGEDGLLIPPAVKHWEFESRTVEPEAKLVRQLKGAGKLSGFGERGIQQVAAVAAAELGGSEPFHCRVRRFPPADLSAEVSLEKFHPASARPAETPVPVPQPEVRYVESELERSALSPILVRAMSVAAIGLAGIVALLLANSSLRRTSDDGAGPPAQAGSVREGDELAGAVAGDRPGEILVPRRATPIPSGRGPVRSSPATADDVAGLRREIERMRVDHAGQLDDLRREIETLKRRIPPAPAPSRDDLTDPRPPDEPTRGERDPRPER